MQLIISNVTTGSPFLDAILSGLLTPLPGLILTLLFFLGPLFIIGTISHRRRKRYKAYADEPFTDEPLRPPGESLRLRIESFSEKVDDALFVMALTGMASVLFVMLSNGPARLGTCVATVVISGAVYLIYGSKLLATQRQLWDCRLGFTGERVVGESLNQLLADGYHVFHDMPFDDFNIDHVIVGPAGVYAVETKARRKPSDIKGKKRAIVVFDGNALIYPRWRDTHGLEQARSNAVTLSKMLTKATGESTSVGALLVIPGWWVDRKARATSVTVLNEKEIQQFIPRHPEKPLSPERIQRMVYQLSQRCRIESER